MRSAIPILALLAMSLSGCSDKEAPAAFGGSPVPAQGAASGPAQAGPAAEAPAAFGAAGSEAGAPAEAPRDPALEPPKQIVLEVEPAAEAIIQENLR